MFYRSLTTRPVIALVGVESLSAYIIAYELHIVVGEYCNVTSSSLLYLSTFRKVMLPLFLCYFIHYAWTGPRSSVGIATELRAGRSGDRIPVGPWGPPSSCTIGTGSFPGVKYGRGVLLTTHPLLVQRSWKSTAIPLPTLWATTGPVTGNFIFYLY